MTCSNPQLIRDFNYLDRRHEGFFNVFYHKSKTNMTITYCRQNLVILLLLVLAVFTINFNNIIAALHHHYYVYEPDAYMHMVEAADLLNNHDWYQHFNLRVNAPFGSDTHSWTQVIAALLVIGTQLFTIIMPLSAALYLWSFLLPMLCNAISAFAMLWAIKLLKPSYYQQLFIAAAFLLNPFLNPLFAPLRVDYDFFLITLSIIYWGYLLRLIAINKKIRVIPVAIIAGLGMWTSISFIMIVFIGLSFIAWLSIVAGRMRVATLNALLAALCIVLTLAIRLEHYYFFTVAHDIVSIVHLTFFLLLLFGGSIYSNVLEHRKKSVKIIFMLGAMSSIFFLMNYLFPGFYYGPYNHVSPYLLKHFFPVLSEFYSPFRIDSALTLALLSYFIIGIGFFYYLYLNNKILELQISLLIWASLIMMGLTLYMYRWNEFFSPLTIFLVSFFVARCCNKKMNQLAKIGLIIAMTLLPSLILSLARTYVPLKQLQCQQQFYNMMHDNFLEGPQFRSDKIIFAHSNYGPLLLYSTHYSIIATNDHHNPDGLKDSFNFFNADEAGAKDIVSKRHVDLILLCQAEHATHFSPDKSLWLEPITVPEKYSLWHLYRKR